MRNMYLIAHLCQAKTPQEFMVMLEGAELEVSLSYVERVTLLAVRDALGSVLNKSTPTWIPNVKEDAVQQIETQQAEPGGARQLLWPREGDRVIVQHDSGQEFAHLVQQRPWQLGHGEWVIGLSDLAGGYLLSRVVKILVRADEEKYRFGFWDAVNVYAASWKGNASAINDSRMDAVMAVNKEVDLLITARLKRAVTALKAARRLILETMPDDQAADLYDLIERALKEEA